jgi:hypothetical protein
MQTNAISRFAGFSREVPNGQIPDFANAFFGPANAGFVPSFASDVCREADMFP